MGRRLLSALLALALLACSTREPEPQGPGPDVLRRLDRGVNLSHALVNGEQSTPRWVPQAADYRQIRALGFQHVRSLIPLGLLLDPERPETLNPAAVALLRQVVADVNGAGLMFVLALHLEESARYQLESPVAQQRLQDYWQQLATAFSDFPPESLLFELLNEPLIEDVALVQALMERLAATVRQAAPRHTIVVAGAHYDDVEDLTRLKPLQDRNAIYGFHFYQPSNFTHQGASWGWSMWRKFHSLPYPSSPEALAPVLPQLPEEAREHAAWYGEERWNRDKLSQSIAEVAAWGQRQGVTVWCSEFGVYRYYLAESDREAWLRDVRGLLEAHGIAWTHWDYNAGFGVMQADGQPDPRIVQALGLNP